MLRILWSGGLLSQNEIKVQFCNVDKIEETGGGQRHKFGRRNS